MIPSRHFPDRERMRFELAGQLGYYQAQLDLAREQIKLLERPKPEASPQRDDVAVVRRRWWQAWRHS